MTEFALQPAGAFPINRLPALGLQRPAPPSTAGAHPFRPAPGRLSPGTSIAGRGAEAAPPGFKPPRHGNHPCAHRMLPLLPIGLARVAVAGNGALAQNGSPAADGAQTIDMQGKFSAASANRGCPMQGAHRAARHGAPRAKRMRPPRRRAPRLKGAGWEPSPALAARHTSPAGLWVWLSVNDRARAVVASGWRPPRGAHEPGSRRWIYNYFGGSP